MSENELAEIEVTVFHGTQECRPLGLVAGQYVPGRVFAVTDKDTVRRRGDFNTVTFPSAAAGFTPVHMRRVHVLVYLSYSSAMEEMNVVD